MSIYSISPKTIYWLKTLSKFASVQVIVQFLAMASGILLVRTLSKDDYAYYTLANAMQSTMNILSDSGISIALTAIGGKVWQDPYRFGQLVNTAMLMRRYLTAISIAVVAPILLWMLVSNGTSVIYAICIVAAVILALNAQLTTAVLDVVPRLHSQITRLQNLDLISTVSRLVLLGAAYFTFMNAAVAIFIASISLIIKQSILNRWVIDNIDKKAPICNQDRKSIFGFIKLQAPNSIFFCVQGQITVFIIGIFGNTHSIAEVGALGRLAAIFLIFNSIMNNVVAPGFSKCQKRSLLIRRYWQILGIYFLIFAGIIAITLLFPHQILWILGKQYSHLQNELFWMMLSAVLNAFVGVIWYLNFSKGWIEYAWVYIPVTLMTQIVLLSFINLSSIKGVIIFGLLSLIPSLLVGLYMNYKGLNNRNNFTEI